jgi:hypothetical protein
MSQCVTVHPEDTRTKDTLCVALNPDATVFAVGTTSGMAVYCADPFVLLRDHAISGGIKHIALFSQSNVMALVPASYANTVWLWDDTVVDPASKAEITVADDVTVTVAAGAAAAAAALRASTVAGPSASPNSRGTEGGSDGAATAVPLNWGEADAATGAPRRPPMNVVAKLELETPVMAVKLHKRCIVVSSAFNVYLFDTSLRRVATFEIDPMACRVLAMSALDVGANVNIAIPGNATGNLVLIEYHDTPPQAAGQGAAAAAPNLGLRGHHNNHHRHHHHPQTPYKLVTSAPHHSTLGAVAMSHEGKYVVSASVVGTALKLIETRSGSVLRQLNRGTTSNTLHSLSFNSGGSLIVCVSETGTVHIFNTGANTTATKTEYVEAENPHSLLVKVAQTVRDNSSFAVGSRMQDAMSFAQGDFAFATFSIPECDATDNRRVFKGSIAALRQGVHHGRATMIVGQCDWGRLFKVAVDVTKGGEASGASASGRPTRCVLQWTARFPEQEL